MNYDDDNARRRSTTRSGSSDMYDDDNYETPRRSTSKATSSNNARRSTSYEGRSYDSGRSTRATSYDDYSNRRSYSRVDDYDEEPARRQSTQRASSSYRTRNDYDEEPARRQNTQRTSSNYRTRNDYDEEPVRRQSAQRASSNYRTRGDYDEEPVRRQSSTRRAPDRYASSSYSSSRASTQSRRAYDDDEYDFSDSRRRPSSPRSTRRGYSSRRSDSTGKYAIMAILAVLIIIAIPVSKKIGLFTSISATSAGAIATVEVPFDDVFATPTADPSATEAPSVDPTAEPTPEPTEIPGKLLSSGRILDPDKKAIALTFDDGPSKYSRKILETLAQYDGRCTFFVVGERLDDYSETLQMEYEAGCQVGMHTYTHANLRKLSKDEILEEINKTNDLIYKYLGVYSTLVRPPYGAVNDTVKETVEQPMINWSIDTRDWESRDADSVYNEIMSNVEDGDIILMHDLYSSTADAVARVVPDLVEQGYQLCTIEELFELKGIELNAGSVYLSAKSKSSD